jgi:hypothetical protein
MAHTGPHPVRHHRLPILRAEMRIGLQPAVAALLVLAQLPLPVMGSVGLLGGHRQPTRQLCWLVVATPPPAKHPARLAPGGRWWAARIASACSRWALTRTSSRPRSRGGLIELAAQPVPLGPQLHRRQPPHI